MKKFLSVFISLSLLLTLTVTGLTAFAAKNSNAVEEVLTEDNGSVEEDGNAQTKMSKQVIIILCVAGGIGLLSGAYALFTIINMKTKAPKKKRLSGGDGLEEPEVRHSATYLGAQEMLRQEVAEHDPEAWSENSQEEFPTEEPLPPEKETVREQQDWMNASVDDIMAELEKEVQINADGEAERTPPYEEYR